MQWRSQDDRVTRALCGPCVAVQCLEAEKQLRICVKCGNCTLFLAIRKGSRTISMHFNIVFELDSGLFLAAAAAEGVQQSNEAY